MRYSFRNLKRLQVRLAVAVACVAMYFGRAIPAEATALVVADARQLAGVSDVVVVGTVESTESVWEGKRIVTRAVVTVTDRAKGKTEQQIRVVVPGGTVDGVTMRVIGGARIRSGDRSVLFLRRSSRDYRIVGLSQGKLDVFQDGSARASVRWVAPGDSKPSIVLLEDAVDALRAEARRSDP